MGTENITLKSVILSDGTFGTINNTKLNSLPGIAKGEMVTLNLTVDTAESLDITGKSLNFVKVQGLCLDVVPVEDTCWSTQACWIA